MDGVSGVQGSCIDLLRRRLDHPAAVAVAASSPNTGRFSWSAGTAPDGTPVTTQTRMYAGSITKQFVAALAGRATLAGQLDVSTSVGTILPALPAWAEPVQVRHLVHHTAGLPPTAQSLSVLDLSDEAALDNQLVLRGLSRLPQPRDLPGGVFAYSNIGYVLLAEVLRVVTGVDPADLARRELLTPLGLTESSIGERLRPTPFVTRRRAPRETAGSGRRPAICCTGSRRSTAHSSATSSPTCFRPPAVSTTGPLSTTPGE